MGVKIGSARIDENGNARGGKAGDQRGGEVATQKWYLHTQGRWRVFRAKSEDVREAIARNMQAACDNNNIGYDQDQRDTLYKAAKPLGFDCARVTDPVETDCSALVRVCCAFAGIDPGNIRTWSEPSMLMATGAFVEMQGAKYQTKAAYLMRGDILCTPSSGHTVVVLSNGDKAGDTPAEENTEVEMMMLVKRGSTGPQVKTLQRLLNAVCGAELDVDGEYGPATEQAVRSYQISRALDNDGQCGAKTWAQLLTKEA